MLRIEDQSIHKCPIFLSCDRIIHMVICFSIDSYSEGNDRSILVNATLVIKQSNIRSGEETADTLKKILKNYTDIPQAVGIFGRIPSGYEKNL